jgi:hypothetical protein
MMHACWRHEAKERPNFGWLEEQAKQASLMWTCIGLCLCLSDCVTGSHTAPASLMGITHDPKLGLTLKVTLPTWKKKSAFDCFQHVFE